MKRIIAKNIWVKEIITEEIKAEFLIKGDEIRAKITNGGTLEIETNNSEKTIETKRVEPSDQAKETSMEIMGLSNEFRKWVNIKEIIG